MHKTDPVQQMLISLYAAPLRPELWETFLAQMGAAFGITKAALIAHDLPRDEHKILAILGDSVRDSLEPYERHYGQHDEWAKRFLRHKNKLRHSLLQGEEVLPEALLVRTTWYNEFLKPFDVNQLAVLGAWSEGTSIEALSVYRSPQEERLNPQLLSSLQFLVPHVQNALEVRRQLATLETNVSDLTASLDALPQGVALFDKRSQCIFLNSAARKIVDRRDGLLLSGRTLTAERIREADAVQEMISSLAAGALASGRHPRAARVTRRKHRPLYLVAAPFQPESVPGITRATAIVFISDPDEVPIHPADLLRSLFGLTAAESMLAATLLNGHSLAEAAELHSVATGTARTQLKSVMQKMGVNRQSELMRLLAGLAIPRPVPR
jgi:DNA-binding CsgD family transcriptional regulator/PAS domain-containing protein